MPALSRRTFLHGTGVAIALPLLESHASAAQADAGPLRIFTIHAHLGFYPDTFWPSASGRDYQLSEALKPLEPLKDDFTVIQGMTHPGVKGGHGAANRALTATPTDITKNGISFDQLAAEHVGEHTRFSSIEMGGSVSINRSGVKIPGWGSQTDVYKRLFLAPDEKQLEQTIAGFREGRSVLDAVREQSKVIAKKVSVRDRAKLDEYYSSIRHVERRLEKAEAWAHKPMADVPLKETQVKDVRGSENLKAYTSTWGELARLALLTDSSRVLTWDVGINRNLTKVGFAKTWHGLTHTETDLWGKFDVKLFDEFSKVLQSLKNTDELGASLLDRTMVLFTSPLGNARNHRNNNMPALLAGGPFRHGQHLKFDEKSAPPYPNLFTSMLQAQGIPCEKFATATGTLTGLELKPVLNKRSRN
ncbi:DUF1552 domain-containing protein [Stratiformator vulcanicus]|uniref:DUF1552 domain-containing protein n=1 Tax=Stratiformator vulcanicus TaxID=2527980 RepID=A0A517QYC2_9PLAN|nr:DUF1552 domain-containing protein [Stratiformator vulcanicus]QDT36647.1 hypothetical protein Pan189_10080 [Stratiformator vulcanicus]